MKAIPTTYAGTKFRSRVEARWAIFFDCAGILFVYEPDGYRLGNEAYLPDFWLPGFNMFMEIKGQEPSEEECAKCEKLTRAAECDVLLAVGTPAERFQIHWFDLEGQRDHHYVIARDFHSEWGFYLVAEGCDHENWIGPPPKAESPRIRRGPMLTGALELAYLTAGGARFEHGQAKVGRYEPIPEPEYERRSSLGVAA